MSIGHVGDVSFRKLISADLGRSITAVPQSLDNQWFDRELLGRAIREGGVSEAILREQARRSRREYLRALLNAEKVLVNRAFLYNSPQVYRDFAGKGRDREAFREMLRQGVIIPMLLWEDGPVPESDPHFQVTEGLEAWRRVAESTMMSCLRLSWDDTENRALAENVNKTFAAFPTGFVQFEVPALQRDFRIGEEEARGALLRLKEVGRWVFDELDAGRPVVRQRLYEKFIVGEGGDVARREYDVRRPHMAVVKQLIDLKYATNLADAVDVFALTPSDSPRRTALQEGLAHVRKRRDGGETPWTDADELITLLRNLTFEDVQGLLEAVPTLDHLSLADIWQVRNEREWHAYNAALARVINAPSIDALADPDTGVTEISRAYLAMLHKAEEVRNDRSGERFGGLTQIAIDIGAVTVGIFFLPGDGIAYELLGEVGSLAGSRLARVTLRLGLGRYRGNTSSSATSTRTRASPEAGPPFSGPRSPVPGRRTPKRGSSGSSRFRRVGSAGCWTTARSPTRSLSGRCCSRSAAGSRRSRPDGAPCGEGVGPDAFTDAAGGGELGAQQAEAGEDRDDAGARQHQHGDPRDDQYGPRDRDRDLPQDPHGRPSPGRRLRRRLRLGSARRRRGHIAPRCRSAFSLWDDPRSPERSRSDPDVAGATSAGAASISAMRLRSAAPRARGRVGTLVHRMIARTWKRLGGRMQWRLARLRHPTFLVYAGGIVRDEQGRILLLRHRLWPAYRAWGLPGGYVNAGERLEDGVAREILEETSLEVEVTGRPVGVASGFRHRVEAYYEARVTGGLLRLDSSEILEARWYADDELPDEMSPRLRNLIRSL